MFCASGSFFLTMNHNVLLTWIFTFLDAVSRGMYATTVLSGFLFHITDGSNAKVGLAEGLQGISLAALAVPAGLATDNWKTAKVLKVSGLCCGFTLALLFGLIFLNGSFIKTNLFWFLTVGLMLFGAEQSFRWTALMTIYADSVPRKERTWYNNMRRMFLIIGFMIGPLLAIIIFSIFGDDWTFMELRIVFAVGLAIRSLTCVVVIFFDDTKTLGLESAAIVGTNRTTRVRYGHLVPYIITISDFIKAFAAGMTIKFFPLFFKNEVYMSPAQVSAISATTYFLLTFFIYLSGKVSDWLGKIQTLLLAAICGSSLLILMAVLKSHWSNWRVIVPVYVFRTIFMNSCSGIRKSVLMDFVPKKSRGKWNAADGITRFSWSGSAMVGGLLIDKYGYGYTFLITAALQLAGYSVLIPLLYILPPEKVPNEELAAHILSPKQTNQGKIMSQPTHTTGYSLKGKTMVQAKID